MNIDENTMKRLAAAGIGVSVTRSITHDNKCFVVADCGATTFHALMDDEELAIAAIKLAAHGVRVRMLL